MTIAPLGVTPTTPTAPADPDGAAPTDFVSAIMAALTTMGAEPPPAVADAPAAADVEPVETPARQAQSPIVVPPPLDKLGVQVAALAVEPVEGPVASVPAAPAVTKHRASKEATTAAADTEPIATPGTPTAAPVPTAVPANLAALVGQYSLMPAPRSATGIPATAPSTTDTGAELDRPELRGAMPIPRTPDLAVAGTTTTTKEPTPVPAGVDSSPVPAPAIPLAPQPTATTIQPAIMVAPTAPTSVPAPALAPAAPNTTPLDQIAAQVFPEVTGLVGRGNGTHRISLTLNPEHLGEVRVVMTMRVGAVHVRLAAGQEAHASLLEGSPELSRLLEHAGATEVRVVVRDLPVTASASTTNPSTATTDTPGNSTLTGDRSPDQHAGTRADHQARDGSDHTPRSIRTDGPITGVPRSMKPVIAARTAGVDLTM